VAIAWQSNNFDGKNLINVVQLNTVEVYKIKMNFNEYKEVFDDDKEKEFITPSIVFIRDVWCCNRHFDVDRLWK